MGNSYFHKSEEILLEMVVYSYGKNLDYTSSIWVIGAHRFEEHGLLKYLFPHLKEIILIEANPEMANFLRENISDFEFDYKGRNIKITVIECAISNFNGYAPLYITNNDGASSSLLPMKDHTELYKDIKVCQKRVVRVGMLESFCDFNLVKPPDALFIDAEGSEFAILSSCSEKFLKEVQLIYTETSLSEMYEGSKTFLDLCKVLEETHSPVLYSPLDPEIPQHGNAVFLRK